MDVKLKCRPEDFIVAEEIARPALSKRGPYGLYTLSKSGWNTVSLVEEIARRTRTPFERWAWGGRKDRHGLTTQHVSYEGKRLPDFEEKAWSFKFVGFMERPMGPDLIEKNRFRIVVRDLSVSAAETALSRLDDVRAAGYPNYFDDQRFGSYDPLQGFVAEKILKGHENGALKAYLTSVSTEDTPEDLKRKGEIFDRWRDWEHLKAISKTPDEKRAFFHLVRKRGDFLHLLKTMIPRDKLSLSIAAYQAYLWNETVRRLVVKLVPGPFLTHRGAAGEYLFYVRPAEAARRALDALEIPTISSKCTMPDKTVAAIHEEILAENGVEKAMFNKMKVRTAFFKSTPRKAVMRPESPEARSFADERYSGRTALELSFALPRGAYGTMLVKRLFADAPH